VLTCVSCVNSSCSLLGSAAGHCIIIDNWEILIKEYCPYMSLWCGASKRRLCACIWKINVMENIAIENVACLHGYSLKYFLLMTCAVKVCYSKKGMDILPLIPVCTSLDFCHWWSSLFSPEAFIIILRGQVTLANQCSYKYLSIFLCTCWTSSFKSAFSSHMSCHVQYFFFHSYLPVPSKYV